MQDKKAFVAVIQANKGLIHKAASLYTNSVEDAEDLYQDIVYHLWKGFANFRGDAKISTWIYRIALNTAITYLKKEKRKPRLQPVTESLLNRSETTDTAATEAMEKLFTQLKALNAVEKGLIFLYLEGKSYEEIAGITGFTVSNVGTRLARIRQKLSNQIKNT